MIRETAPGLPAEARNPLSAEAFDRLLAEVAGELRRGGAVVFPTETYYALGADPRSAAGRASIFRLKGRPADRALPWIAASRAQVEAVCRFPAAAAALADRHWPGPLTLVLPRRGAEHETAAVRVSSHPVARRLAAALGHPVVSTSANRSGEPPSTTVSGISLDRTDSAASLRILDGGRTPGGAPSVIVDARGGELRVLRGSLAALSGEVQSPAGPALS